MCGIVGYTGYQNAKNIVVDGLKTLEYRGYDSAGIAIMDRDIRLYKTAGRVEELGKILPDLAAHVAIGHTRWATHGVPSAQNAHPHLSFDGQIAVVHNGVITNCEELKKQLIEKGIRFKSTTDSEIIAHLLVLEDTSDMPSAIEKVGKMLQGATTFLAIKAGDDTIYARRAGASLAVGIGIGENFVASDTLAISKHTRKTILLKDGECAAITPNGVRFFKDGKTIEKQPVKIRRTAPKECSCHMRSEIDEIPDAMARTYKKISRSVDADTIEKIVSARKIYFCGCGTAYHAGLYGKYVFEKVLGIPCESIVASEFDNPQFIDDRCVCIFITQSGETADTLLALSECKKAGALTIALTNVAGSTITFEADKTLLLDAGAEVAVAATKSYNCQLLALYLLAKICKNKAMQKCDFDKLVKAVKESQFCNLYDDKIKKSNLFFVGKGVDNVTAKEGALKFKEITYKMTDSYQAGELKHGAIALIDDKSIVVTIVTNSSDKHRIEATVSELRSRGAYVLALSAVGDVGANKTTYLPFLSDDLLYPIVSILPLQNLALTASLCLNLNPDKPRNLAKSVTVI